MFEEDIGLMVEPDEIRTAGAVKASVDMLPAGGVMAFCVTWTDSERTGQTEMMRAGRREVSREGKIDGASERSSTAQRLLFCVTETILSPG